MPRVTIDFESTEHGVDDARNFIEEVLAQSAPHFCKTYKPVVTLATEEERDLVAVVETWLRHCDSVDDRIERGVLHIDGRTSQQATGVRLFLCDLQRKLPSVFDTASSASSQHYIDTGRYLTHAEVAEGLASLRDWISG